MSPRFFTWALKVERLAWIDCSSPTSANTSSKTAMRLARTDRGRDAALNEHRAERDRFEQHGLAAGVRTADEERPLRGSIVRSNGTTVTPCASSNGCRPYRITNPSAGEPSSGTVQSKSSAKRARAYSVSRSTSASSVSAIAPARAGRSSSVSSAQNPFDLAPFLGLELSDAVPCLDGRRRLNEQRGAGRRCVLNDSADDAYALHGESE